MLSNTLTQRRLIAQGRQGDRMPLEKLEAFYKEIPWLKGFIDEMNGERRIIEDDFLYINVRQIFVSGFDRTIMSYELYHKSSYDSSQERGMTHNETMYFLDEHGKRIWVEKEYAYERRRFRFFGKKIQVKDVIKRWAQGFGVWENWSSKVDGLLWLLSEKPDAARFMVSYCNATKALIIYRPPKGMSVLGWIFDPASAVDFASEVRTEVAAAEAI